MDFLLGSLTAGTGGDGMNLGSIENMEVLSLMECPVCLDHITPPIKQCVKGHLVCIDCFPRLHHCPTCRSAMCDERNLAMEQVSRLLQFPCRYHPMGCKKSFPLSQKGAHERDCAFLQLKCPFHGQCVFNGSLADVVPHLAAEHAVTPVPVQPAGTLFYRAKNFYRRNIWTLIYSWDRPSNLFRFIVKHVHATQVGRTDNCNLLIAHIQYIGPESMASRYAYQICLFDAERRATGQKFEGLVTSTLKPIESQCAKTADVSKSEVFVTTFAAARNYTDQWANLNFIIRMKKLVEDEETKKDTEGMAQSSSATVANTESINILMPSTSSGSTSNSNPSALLEVQDAEMQFETETNRDEEPSGSNSQARQSSIADAINIPIVTSSTS